MGVGEGKKKELACNQITRGFDSLLRAAWKTRTSTHIGRNKYIGRSSSGCFVWKSRPVTHMRAVFSFLSPCGIARRILRPSYDIIGNFVASLRNNVVAGHREIAGFRSDTFLLSPPLESSSSRQPRFHETFARVIRKSLSASVSHARFVEPNEENRSATCRIFVCRARHENYEIT
jgi:hypothetical protein